MTIAVTWLDEQQTTLHFLIDGVFVWTEFYAAFEQGVAMTRMVQHPVYGVYENTDNVSGVPPSAMLHLRTLVARLPANAAFACVVIEGDTFTTRMWVQILTTLGRLFPPFHQRVRIASSLDEARRMIAEDQAQRAA